MNYIKHVRENKAKWDYMEMFTNSVCNFKYEGYDIVVKLEPDEWCDFDWDGKFTGTWSKDVVPNPKWGRFSASTRENILPYWLPANPWRTAWRVYREAYKLGRHEAYTRAREEARDDADRSENRELYVLTVQAYKEGVLLGTDSLGGIEFSDEGSRDPYIYDLLNDLVPCAIDAAGAVLKKLCEV